MKVAARWGSTLVKQERLSYTFRRTTEYHYHREFMPSLLLKVVKWKGSSPEAGTFVWMCMWVCSRSNLEGAGGYSLFDVINSHCSLLAARREPVNILPHAPLFIFYDLLTATILWAHPSWSPLSVINIAYDINDNINHTFCKPLLTLKKKKTANLSQIWKIWNLRVICDTMQRFPLKNTAEDSELWNHILEMEGGGKSAPKWRGVRMQITLSFSELWFIIISPVSM